MQADGVRARHRQRDGPTIVIAQAGQHQHRRLRSDRARSRRSRMRSGAWVHVDGAFGLWARACPSTAHAGRRASSRPTPGRPTAINGCRRPTTAASRSCAMPRRIAARWRSPRATCRRSPTASATRSHFVPELSRRARGFATWAMIRALGRRRHGAAGRASLRHRAPHGARAAPGSRHPRAERGGAQPGRGALRRRRSRPTIS